MKSPEKEAQILPTTLACEASRGTDTTGKSIPCGGGGRVAINGKPLCERHAELTMTALCGRETHLE